MMQISIESNGICPGPSATNELPTRTWPDRDSGMPLVIAMHCSGGVPEVWSALSSAAPAGCEMYCPTHRLAVSGNSVAPEYSLHFEAEPIIAQIDAVRRPVYLVGHSFGGALALHVAKMRPRRVIGVSVYEPCVFGWLNGRVPRESAALYEVCGLREQVCKCMQQSDPEAAMKLFVDYWGGAGFWALMPSDARQKMIEWAPNAVHQFDALFNFRQIDVSGMRMPVRIVTGEFALIPSLVIAHRNNTALPNVRWQTLAGMGHMGPVVNAAGFAKLVRAHLADLGVKATVARQPVILRDALSSLRSIKKYRIN